MDSTRSTGDGSIRIVAVAVAGPPEPAACLGVDEASIVEGEFVNVDCLRFDACHGLLCTVIATR